MIKPIVIDAGARYGLHPTWQPLQDIAEFHLFDIDNEECKRLKEKYLSNKNINIHNIGLSNHKSKVQYREFAHKALNSLYEVNKDVINPINHMINEFEEREKKWIDLDSLDNLFLNREIHFLKLDIEGGELALLEGCRQHLSESIIGVRCEVAFCPIFKNAPLFTDINAIMNHHGFDFLNLDYQGQGVAVSPFTKHDKYGYLVTTDGVWIPSQERLFKEQWRSPLSQRALFLAVFLFENGASDVAIHFLTKTIEMGSTFEEYKDSSIFRYLELKILHLFKEISAYPQTSYHELSNICERVLGYPFPKMHHFFEKIDSLHSLNSASTPSKD